MAKKSEKIEKNYAQVLFELSPREKHEYYLNILKEWQKIVAEVPEFQKLLLNPAFSEYDRNTIICETLQEFSPNDQMIMDFFMELAKNKRLEELPNIIECYTALLQKELGIQPIDVISAYEIVEEEKYELRAAIEKTLHTNTVINWCVDESLIGGLIIKIGDAVIDNSIKGALKNIKHELQA